MNPWQEWKARNIAAQEAGNVSVLAAVNPDSPKVSDAEHSQRMSVCEKCPKLMVTKQCSECGCYMPIKSQLMHASCPLEKW